MLHQSSWLLYYRARCCGIKVAFQFTVAVTQKVHIIVTVLLHLLFIYFYFYLASACKESHNMKVVDGRDK